MRYCTLFFLSLLAVFVPAADNFKTRHVFIVVMDGARWSETWGDAGGRNIPHLDKELAPQGVLLTQFSNRGVTTTNPGHTAISTGFYQDIDNSGLELPRFPSLFQYLRRQQGVSDNEAWVIASKDKLVVLSDTSAQDWRGNFRPAFDCGGDGRGGGGYRDDAVTFARTQATIKNHKPIAMLVNFRGPDSYGHANDRAGYLAAIAEVDGYISVLWQTIQAEARLKDCTTLFVTNDHGRHLDQIQDGFVSHGCDCAGCRHLMCLAVGPDFKRGVRSDTPRHLPDITATAARLLGVAMPTGTGTVMTEIFAHLP